MATLTEGRHAGEFIVSEANGNRSRDTVAVISGQNLKAGHVVGIITASGKVTEMDPAATNGSEVAAGVLFAPVDASAGDAPGVLLARDCEVTGADLTYKTGATAGQITTAEGELETLGIIVR